MGDAGHLDQVGTATFEREEAVETEQRGHPARQTPAVLEMAAHALKGVVLFGRRHRPSGGGSGCTECAAQQHGRYRGDASERKCFHCSGCASVATPNTIAVEQL